MTQRTFTTLLRAALIVLLYLSVGSTAVLVCGTLYHWMRGIL